MPYPIRFTDTSKTPIDVPDQQLDQRLSISFIGKNYPSYSQAIGENFLHLLENFAGPIAPLITKSVAGQLWYDSTNSQLKVFDGVSYTPAGSVFKSFTAPINKKVGDLWVDLTNKQFKFWSGVDWILIGPQFSEGSNSGPLIDTILDTLNIAKIVIRFVVGGETIIILSKEKFVPKLTIDGFVEINPGINLSSKVFGVGTSNVANKFWGTAEKASALLIGNNTIDATKFLRSDTSGSTDYKFSIRSDEGLSLGVNNNVSFSTNAAGELTIFNNTSGASINFKTYTNPNVNSVLSLIGNKVGINNINPIKNLDLIGNARFSDTLEINSTTDIANTPTTTNLAGALVVSGGVSVAKKLYVGSDINIDGSTKSKNIIPKAASTYNLGDTTTPYNRVYADVVGNQAGTTQFYGNFSGVYTGNISGTASQLSNKTTFSIAGDVKTTPGGTVLFDGADGGLSKIFTVEIDPTFLNDKSEITTANSTGLDIFLVIQDNTIKKTTRSQMFARIATIPVGTVFPFAGSEPPNGYLLCDGAEVLRSVYPELYNVIGGTYNVGTLVGAGTFKIPDFRGRLALGRDTMFNNISVPQSLSSYTGFSGTIQTSLISSTVTTITGLSSISNLITGQFLSKTGGTGAFGGITTILSIDSPTQITISCADPYTAGSISFTATTSSTFVTTPTTAADRVSNSFADSLGGTLTENAYELPINNVVANTGIKSPFMTVNYIIFTGRFRS